LDKGGGFYKSGDIFSAIKRGQISENNQAEKKQEKLTLEKQFCKAALLE